MNLKLLLALVTMVALIFSGCQTTEPAPDRVPLDYLAARFYDFMDIFEFNAGFDLTFDNFYVVAAIEPLALGGGYYDSEKLGLDGRLFGRWRETRTEADFLFDCLIGYEKTPTRGNRYLFDGMYKPMTSFRHDDGQPYRAWGVTQRLFDREHHPFDATAEIYLFFIGIDLGLSPVELLDFVAGIFTIDAFSDDDYVNPQGWDPSATGAVERSDASDVAIILPGITRTRGFREQRFSVDDISTVPPCPGLLITLQHVPGTPPRSVPEKVTRTAPAPPMSAPPQEEPAVLTLESVPKKKQDDTPKKAAEKPQEKPSAEAQEEMMVITLESIPSTEKSKTATEKKKPAKPEAKAQEKEAKTATPKTDAVKKEETKSAGVADIDVADDGSMVVTLESVAPSETQAAKPAPSPGAEAGEKVAAHGDRSRPGQRAEIVSTPAKNPTPMIPPEMMSAYKTEFGRTDFHESEDLFRLATWCADKGLQRKSIWHLRQTIALDPIHAEARRMLGYVRYGRMWVRANPVDLNSKAGD